jgi:hypothetical protein
MQGWKRCAVEIGAVGTLAIGLGELSTYVDISKAWSVGIALALGVAAGAVRSQFLGRGATQQDHTPG